jgi:ankyrin repeat protein
LALLSGETALMVAARGGFADIAAQLLAKDANPNAHGTRGQTALMWAVSQRHPEVVKVLLASKVDIREVGRVEQVMKHPAPWYHPTTDIPHGGETALMRRA